MNIRCICPPDGNRHPEGDTLTLRERLDFRTVMTIKNIVLTSADENGRVPGEEALAVLSECYIVYGIESWSLRDEKNKPIEPSREAIRRMVLPAIDVSIEVADEADDLYRAAVMLPLLRLASTSSPPTPTAPSTSPQNGHSPRPRKPSKPSSTTTIPTDAIGTTTSLPAGDSSSSPS